MNNLRYWLSLCMIIPFLLILALAPEPGQATQWPPFSFRMLPSYEAGKITYNLKFDNESDRTMADVMFKIPIPEGTRFLEAGAELTTQTGFDGAEVTFFTAVLHRPLRTASFVVEVIDPGRTIFTTQAWIAWQGDQPGDYLTEEISFDITRQPLNWQRPRSRLQLEAGATVANEIISYTIYPKNVGELRMWDLEIHIPLPEGAAFLSAEAPPPFVTNFDGREVSFSILELAQRAEVAPLTLKVSTKGVATPFVTTHAWAVWKNAGRKVGRSVALEEQTVSGDIVVQPHTFQQVTADLIGDVPFSNYDLTSVALQEEADFLKVNFYPAGNLEQIGAPLEYILYIDRDCNLQTGKVRAFRGAEYWVRYRHNRGQAALYNWDAEENNWINPRSLEVNTPADSNVITVRVPYDWIKNERQFCWIGRSRHRTDAFQPIPPTDWIPNGQTPELTQYLPLESSAALVSAATRSFAQIISSDDHSANPLPAPEVGPTSPALPTTFSVADLKGKLAIPLDNGQGFYDVHIFSVPAGQAILKIPNARQPNFRFDGQRLVINREGGGIENVFEYNLVEQTETQVSDASADSHPFYDAWGNRVVYGNSDLIAGKSFILVQCGLRPPHQETEPRCHDISGLGVLSPAGHMGELQGTHPVWAANDSIAYKGCNTWAGAAACGIYIVPATSTKGFSDGFIPTQLSQDTSDIPSDTQGNLIAFTSHRDGNWEAYVMTWDGNNVANLSNSPDSNDGLPTLGPDGSWAAFISDRAGSWAVWATPVAGGPAQKLFDLPVNPAWGDGDRTWTNERISWGP